MDKNNKILTVKSVNRGNSGNAVTESKDKKYFKPLNRFLYMVFKFRDIFTGTPISPQIQDSTQPPIINPNLTRNMRAAPMRMAPDVHLNLPKMNIPEHIKIEFKRDFTRILAEEKNGVVRRKRYGPY